MVDPSFNLVQCGRTIPEVFCLNEHGKASTCSELIETAYNRWGFLRYDVNCEYRPHEPPKEGPFEFWITDVSIPQTERVSAAI